MADGSISIDLKLNSGKVADTLDILTDTLSEMGAEAERASKKLEKALASQSDEEILTFIDEIKMSEDQMQRASQTEVEAVKMATDVAQKELDKRAIATRAALEKQAALEEKAAAESKKRTSAFFKQFGDGIKGAIKKVGKMVLAVFGIRAAYMAVRRVVSAYTQSNEEAAAQLKNVWNVAAEAIAPVLDKLLAWLRTGASYVNAFVKAMWGIDLVARANARALKNQAKAAKQLAGFDQMNTLQSKRGNTAFQTEAVDTSKLQPVIDFVNRLKDKVKEMWASLKPLRDALAAIWDSLKPFFSWAEESLLPILVTIIGDVARLVADILTLVFTALKPLLDVLLPIVETVVEFVAGGLHELITMIDRFVMSMTNGDGLVPLIESIAVLVKAVWNEVYPIIKFAINAVNKLFDGMSGHIGEVLGGIMVALSGVVDFISGVLSGDFEKAWRGIGNIFVGLFNMLIGGLNTAIRGVLNAINSVVTIISKSIISVINSFVKGANGILGTEWKTIPVPSSTDWGKSFTGFPTIPKLAAGAIVNNPSRGVPVIAGEAGAEAILPLEQNTGWMDMLADRIAARIGGGTIVVQLDGRTIQRQMYKQGRKMAFETGGLL